MIKHHPFYYYHPEDQLRMASFRRSVEVTRQLYQVKHPDFIWVALVNDIFCSSQIESKPTVPVIELLEETMQIRKQGKCERLRSLTGCDDPLLEAAIAEWLSFVKAETFVLMARVPGRSDPVLFFNIQDLDADHALKGITDCIVSMVQSLTSWIDEFALQPSFIASIDDFVFRSVTKLKFRMGAARTRDNVSSSYLPTIVSQCIKNLRIALLRSGLYVPQDKLPFAESVGARFSARK